MFWKDNLPFQIIGGDLHYFRVLPQVFFSIFCSIVTNDCMMLHGIMSVLFCFFIEVILLVLHKILIVTGKFLSSCSLKMTCSDSPPLQDMNKNYIIEINKTHNIEK